MSNSNVYIIYFTNLLIALKTMISYTMISFCILVYLNKHNPASSDIQSLSGTVDPDRNESIDQPSKSIEGSQKNTLQVIHTTFQYLFK